MYCAPAHKVRIPTTLRPGRRVSEASRAGAGHYSTPPLGARPDRTFSSGRSKISLRLADTLPEEVQAEARAAVYGACLYGAFEARGEDFALYGYDSAEALRAAF